MSNLGDVSLNNYISKYNWSNNVSNNMNIWDKKCWGSQLCQAPLIQDSLNTTSLDRIVDWLNADYSLYVAPLVVFMALLMLSGLVGNATVIIVYWNKDNKPMANYFMLYLAIVDFFSCLLLHPYVISKLFHFYNPNVIVCKVFEFLMHLSFSVQCALFLAIAIDRYYAVCCPVKFLTSLKRNYWTLSIELVLAVLFSIPIIFLYGHYTIPVTWNNTTINVGVCHNNDLYNGSLFQKVFSSVIVVLMIAILLTMVILYSKMSYRVMTRRKDLSPVPLQHDQGPLMCPLITEPYLKTAMKETSMVSTIPDEVKADSNLTSEDKRPSIQTLRTLRKDSTMTTSGSDNISTGRRDEERDMTQGERQGCTNTPKRGLKTAKMLFLVTVVFFLSWLPFWVLKIITIVSPTITWDRFEHDVTLKCLYHLFYINNAVNPVIYTFINRHFKVDIRNFIRRHCGNSD